MTIPDDQRDQRNETREKSVVLREMKVTKRQNLTLRNKEDAAPAYPSFRISVCDGAGDQGLPLTEK